MKSFSILRRQTCSPRKRCAFTLVEVMVSTLIFAMTSISLASLALQNQRYAKFQTLNVQLVNTTFSILDQIKNKGADQIWQAYQAPTTNTLSVNYVDPTDIADGYRSTNLAINKVDNTEYEPNWKIINLTVGNGATTATIPVMYWIALRRNLSKSGNVILCDTIELTLVYQWKIGGKATKYVGQLQLTFPAPNRTFK